MDFELLALPKLEVCDRVRCVDFAQNWSNCCGEKGGGNEALNCVGT